MIALNSVADGGDLFAACNRSSFKTLVRALDAVKTRITIEKSEFETDAEFAARREKMEGAVNQVGRVVVCQPLADNDDAPFKYDAERQVFAGSFRARQNVWRDVKHTGRYVSRTRMGVRATVSASVDLEYDVDMDAALQARKPACLKWDVVDYSYEVPSPRADAPLVKSIFYLVYVGYVGKLTSPFVERSDSPGAPTLDDPHAVFERTLTVSFAPDLVAIVGPGGTKPWECRVAGG